MKRTFILAFILIITTGTVFSQNSDYSNIWELVAKKQYLSAINQINNEKKNNDNPQLIDIQVQVTIEGFVQSLNHRLFAFKDLAPDEDVLELRRNGGNFSIVFGDLREEIEKYIKQFPESYYVYKAAGDYYADILLRYGDQLEEYSYNDLYNLIIKNYETAYSLGCTDIEVIAGVGEYSLYKDDFEKAIEFYKIALYDNPRNASYNYNLSIAFQNVKDFENALIHSQIAIEEYENAAYKADSFHIHGYQNRMIGRNNEAIEMYTEALKLNPDLYYSQVGLIDLLLQENIFEDAKSAFNEILLRNINDFRKIQDFIRIYFNHGESGRVFDQITELITLTENNIHKGTLYYHLGVIDNSVGRNPTNNLLNAKEFYLKEMNNDEDIIKHIDDFLSKVGK